MPDRAARDLSRLCARAGALARPGIAHARCCAHPTPTACARNDAWSPGARRRAERREQAPAIAVQHALDRIVRRARAPDDRLGEAEIVTLFQARGGEFDAVCGAADELRRSRQRRHRRATSSTATSTTPTSATTAAGSAPSPRASSATTLRGPAYDLDHDEIARRVREAWERGATEVCMQGGIHPRYTGATYLDILDAAKRAAPRHPRACILAARGAARRDEPRACASAIISTGCATRASALCRAPRPRSSTTRCAPCSARTSSRPRNGST